jgi:anti-sigma regulatory factor (Ser/Thr protein kinase)
MSEQWGRRAPPESGARRYAIWHGEPATETELSAQRAQLRGALADDELPSDDDDVERILLVFEELASNGLRHGRRPIRVVVTATSMGWMLAVSDAAADHPPTPAVDRDPAEGGMGLFIVARLCTAYGWDAREGRKTVWGRIDSVVTRAAPYSAA